MAIKSFREETISFELSDHDIRTAVDDYLRRVYPSIPEAEFRLDLDVKLKPTGELKSPITATYKIKKEPPTRDLG